jgi:hypothetical protein
MSFGFLEAIPEKFWLFRECRSACNQYWFDEPDGEREDPTAHRVKKQVK